ncbi:hypothetical protein DesyoDRAFT_2793 [Desulfosporosinus youngiae DSM 17734]|uniref:Uncharacterized protein n=1 Tax=Desulfosporosinus youngiae DSM 17734 TaxID=768710 RepID=H5XVA7_9FIRM|nr:hypothetical protein DesyoDRAFT_2793 [Desulfosporosinus youngiae DSM 17734]
MRIAPIVALRAMRTGCYHVQIRLLSTNPGPDNKKVKRGCFLNSFWKMIRTKNQPKRTLIEASGADLDLDNLETNYSLALRTFKERMNI